MNEKVVITQAEASDLPRIVSLFVETINTVCTKDYSAEQRAAWAAGAQNTKRWRSKLETQYFLVAKQKEAIAGFASLENNHIDFLFVHKDFQRRGIAKRLFEAIQNKAIETKIETLASDVSLTARPFFEKMGFSVIRGQNQQIRGVILTNFRMEKHIG